jgi:hypothetical protein
MEINFRSKEESNQIQRDRFLELSPANRIYSFIELTYIFNSFPSHSKKNKKGNNFIINL